MCHVSCVMCHVSPVTCHVSPVTCHLSLVRCHLKKKIILQKKLDTVVELVGGASVINGAYPVEFQLFNPDSLEKNMMCCKFYCSK